MYWEIFPISKNVTFNSFDFITSGFFQHSRKFMRQEKKTQEKAVESSEERVFWQLS